MTIFEGFVLGIVQGLTEFLPVSSTGHLIIVREILGFTDGGGLAVDATLHLVTAFAVLAYFWKDVWGLVTGILKWEKQSLILGAALIVGTVPAVAAGLLFNDYIETTVRGIGFVIIGLLVGSLIMALAEKYQKVGNDISIKSGFLVGVFQAIALFPGMSRSGMTISAGLLFGLSRAAAARFAFLLSFPVILGAGSLKLHELYRSGAVVSDLYPLIAAATAALISALAAIHFLMMYLKSNSLRPFIWYRLVLAGVLLIYLFVV